MSSSTACSGSDPDPIERAIPKLPDAALWVLAATAYFLAGKLGLALAFVNASATAVWPPAGMAFAAVLIFGPRALPGIFRLFTDLSTAI